MSARVRLLRVTVQPEFVVDDGDTLSPLPLQAVEIPAAQWIEFAADNFAKAIAAIQEQVDQAAAEGP